MCYYCYKINYLFQISFHVTIYGRDCPSDKPRKLFTFTISECTIGYMGQIQVTKVPLGTYGSNSEYQSTIGYMGQLLIGNRLENRFPVLRSLDVLLKIPVKPFMQLFSSFKPCKQLFSSFKPCIQLFSSFKPCIQLFSSLNFFMIYYIVYLLFCV